MASPANYDDAQLILRLYEMRREEKLRAARAWFVSDFKVKTVDDFQAMCPPGSEPNAYYRMVTTYWDMACSFVTSGILNRELFIQNNLEHLLVWERVKHLVPKFREMNRNPVGLRNLEAVAGMAGEWLNQQAAGTYEAFADRFKP